MFSNCFLHFMFLAQLPIEFMVRRNFLNCFKTVYKHRPRWWRVGFVALHARWRLSQGKCSRSLPSACWKRRNRRSNFVDQWVRLWLAGGGLWRGRWRGCHSWSWQVSANIFQILWAYLWRADCWAEWKSESAGIFRGGHKSHRWSGRRWTIRDHYKLVQWLW